MLFAKEWPFCLGPNVLLTFTLYLHCCKFRRTLEDTGPIYKNRHISYENVAMPVRNIYPYIQHLCIL